MTHRQSIIDFTIEEKVNLMFEFMSLYIMRPIKNNQYGMKIPHLFNLYLVLKKLNPKLIVESGILAGQGTWLMQNACPEAKIISFDITLENLVYKSTEVEYNEHDITDYDWDGFFKANPQYNSENSLLFLDDHVDFHTRIDFILSSPFKYVVDEDNYPPDQGDCATPKKILESKKYVIDVAGNRTWHQFEEGVKSQFENSIAHYEELPPIYRIDKTRWGNSGENYKIPEAHFEFDYFQDDLINQEMFDYTWICFIEFIDNKSI